ncbi:twin-arginine translocation signal domain-containing protein, partial [Candidatus Latescibacterota bacterium]
MQQSRRYFIKKATIGTAGIGLAGYIHPARSHAQMKSTVVTVRNEKAVSDRNECDKKQA